MREITGHTHIAACQLTIAALDHVRKIIKIEGTHAFRSPEGAARLARAEEAVNHAAGKVRASLAKTLEDGMPETVSDEELCAAMTKLLARSAKRAHEDLPWLCTFTEGDEIVSHMIHELRQHALPKSLRGLLETTPETKLGSSLKIGRGAGAGSSGVSPTEIALAASAEIVLTKEKKPDELFDTEIVAAENKMLSVCDEVGVYQLRYTALEAGVVQLVAALVRNVSGYADMTESFDWTVVQSWWTDNFAAALERGQFITALYPNGELAKLVRTHTVRVMLPHLFDSNALVNDVVAFVDPHGDDQCYSSKLDHVLMHILEKRSAVLVGIPDFTRAAEIQGWNE